MSGLQVESYVSVAGYSLIPIVNARLDGDLSSSAGGGWCHASREPVALVLCGADGCRAVDVLGQTLSLSDLTAQVEGLTAVLKQCGIEI